MHCMKDVAEMRSRSSKLQGLLQIREFWFYAQLPAIFIFSFKNMLQLGLR